MDQPFDHNAECRFCDEQAAHAADCPWLLQLIHEHTLFAVEIEEYSRSFALYHNASMALMHAYKAAHPEVPDLVWPDATKVNEWAVAEIERLRGFEDAIIDAAVVDWIYTEEYRTNPRKAVNDLLVWQQKLALDPAVSEEAAALHAEIEQLRLQINKTSLP